MIGYYFTLVSISLIVVNASLAQEGDVDVQALKDQWQRLSDNVDNDESVPFRSGRNNVDPTEQSESSELSEQKEIDEIFSVPSTPVDPNAPIVTSSLVDWISSQCESIVEEMDAIARQNAESSSLSVVNYLRYLHLYNDLKVIANERQYPELKWVGLKAKIFGKVYQQTLDVLSAHLEDLDRSLTKVELAEPKSKQNGVSKEWLDLYERILYISSHAPVGSQLEKRAAELLQTSPNNSPDKQRSMRYQLRVRANSK